MKILPLPSSAEEMPPEHEFFNSLSTEESFSVWEHFVPAWQRNFYHRYRLWTNIDPAGFVFSEKCQSDCGAVEMSAEVRSEEVLVKPVSLKNLTFKLADSSLVLLRNAGVPEEILVTLAPLTNRTFENESQLSSELLRALGEEQVLKNIKMSSYSTPM